MSDTSDLLCDINPLASSLNLKADDPDLIWSARRASDRFRGEVGWGVNESTDTLILDPPAGETLLLPVFNPSRVRVEVDDVEDTSVEFSPRTGALRRRGGWGSRLGSIRVSVTHGFKDIPGDIQDAVAEQAAITYAVAGAPGVQQITQGSRSMSFSATSATGTTQKWSAAVNKYRLTGQVAF